MDVPSQRQAEPPTRGFFLRAETEELLADKGHVSNQDTQVHPWSQECSILGWGGGTSNTKMANRNATLRFKGFK